MIAFPHWTGFRTMKYTILIIAFFLPSLSFADKCQGLSWELAVKDGHWATYRGKIKPGTANVAHLELYRTRTLIGTTL